jgi:hypothetical protein
MGKVKREMLSNSYNDVYFKKVDMKLVCEALKRTLMIYINPSFLSPCKIL